MCYDKNWDEDEFSLEIMGVGLVKFRYFTLHLRHMNWRDFIKTDNPVAAALLGKMGYANEERVQIKIEFLRMLVRLQVNPAEQLNYLKLNEEEAETFMKEAREFEVADKILEIPISYEEKGKKIGREEEKLDVARGLLCEGVSKKLF